MNAKRWFAFAPLIVFAGLLAVLGYYNFHKKPNYEPRAMVGQSVPDRPLAGLNDPTPQSLKELAAQAGKPVLVNVFASWCAPCIAENPQLLALKDQGVVIIGIAWQDEPQNTRAFLEKHDNPFAVVLTDQKGQIALDLGIAGVPETYVLQPDGTISDKISGPIIPETVEAVLAAVK